MDEELLSELVSQFVGITDASSDKARQYLSISDNNLEQAIGLFFNTGGVDLTESTSTPSQPLQAPPVPPAHTRPGTQNEVIDLESDEDVMDDDDEGVEVTGSRTRAAESTQHTSRPDVTSGTGLGAQDDDEAMARRLQEEIYAGGDMPGTVDADGYRAPIARTRETLVGSGSYDMLDPGDMHAVVAEQMRLRQERHRGMSSSTCSMPCVL